MKAFVMYCKWLSTLIVIGMHIEVLAVTTAQEQSSQNCIACHSVQFQKWNGSDHDKSMARIQVDTVLGDFNNTKASHHSVTATFFKKEKQFWVALEQDGMEKKYELSYVFGHYPLQQYLIETDNGKMQVLPFAWDSRVKAEGGQRWFHLYGDDIKPNNRLHWLQPTQNWNGMCADCHSDGFQRNFSPETDSFNSHWNEVNVSCLSCHDGLEVPHNKTSFEKEKTGVWQFSGGQTAKWVGKQRNNDFMWNCFSCHSLRSPVTDGFNSKQHYLDNYTPDFLNAPMYHADGQIKEEVYVMGSFLQSKMYKKGVNCLDCHDPHSQEVKVKGNGICLQCHSSKTFNVKEHHGHQDSSEGAFCVNCHMPETTYMGVDDRRDHSFKIPNPALSQMYGTPLACFDCHDNKDHDWAISMMNTWGKNNKRNNSIDFDYASLMAGRSSDGQRLINLLNNDALSEIQKASLVKQLPFLAQQLPGYVLEPYLTNDSALIRIAAAQVAILMSEEDRINLLTPLLVDEYRSVRVTAVNSLLGLKIPPSNTNAFSKAFKELSLAQDTSAWRGEGRANKATSYRYLGKVAEAINEYKLAIKHDPYFDGAYINLADIYRSQNQVENEKNVLLQGLDKAANSPSINYSLALYYVREKDYTNALASLTTVRNLAPKNEQFLYTYLLVVEQAKNKDAAREEFKELSKDFPNTALINQLRAYFNY